MNQNKEGWWDIAKGIVALLMVIGIVYDFWRYDLYSDSVKSVVRVRGTK